MRLRGLALEILLNCGIVLLRRREIARLKILRELAESLGNRATALRGRGGVLVVCGMSFCSVTKSDCAALRLPDVKSWPSCWNSCWNCCNWLNMVPEILDVDIRFSSPKKSFV